MEGVCVKNHFLLRHFITLTNGDHMFSLPLFFGINYKRNTVCSILYVENWMNDNVSSSSKCTDPSDEHHCLHCLGTQNSNCNRYIVKIHVCAYRILFNLEGIYFPVHMVVNLIRCYDLMYDCVRKTITKTIHWLESAHQVTKVSMSSTVEV